MFLQWKRGRYCMQNHGRALVTRPAPSSERPSVDDANYWNSKWQQSSVRYAAPQSKHVTRYLTNTNLPEITQIASSLISSERLSSDNSDKVPITVLRWLDSQFRKGTFQYRLDASENWENPHSVLTSRINDCDGWGIVEYYVIREIFGQLGIWGQVKHRLKCVAGNVNHYAALPMSAGGHFYLNWLHADGYWYTVESTYYRGKAMTNYGKLPQKLNPAYGTIWFTFNEQFSWAQNSLTVTREDFRKL
jgi:hypothetical protein